MACLLCYHAKVAFISYDLIFVLKLIAYPLTIDLLFLFSWKPSSEFCPQILFGVVFQVLSVKASVQISQKDLSWVLCDNVFFSFLGQNR